MKIAGKFWAYFICLSEDMPLNTRAEVKNAEMRYTWNYSLNFTDSEVIVVCIIISSDIMGHTWSARDCADY